MQKIELKLRLWGAFLIKPVFALANAGMTIGGDLFNSLLNTVSLGVICGLVLGKFIGVQLFTWIGVRSGIASLPQGATWKHIRGVAMLAGVGFTMSLFIAGLAFSDETHITQAKYGILLASIVSASLGVFLIKKAR